MKKVISASRRTDIPAFYMEWFMGEMALGHFTRVNPVNGRTSLFHASPDTVHSIVFWSKNFGPFLAGGYGEKLREMGFKLFFNFTLNTADLLLEPSLPPLPARLRQMEQLSGKFGPETINWRFDPICHYRHKGAAANNLAGFPKIAERAAEAGIGRCITSFMDIYPKVIRRAAKLGIEFIDPPPARKVAILLRMEKLLKKKGITLHTCCERAVMERVPASADTRQSACIPGRLLMELFGGRVSVARAQGQRLEGGCGCTASVDVGDYRRQPCGHDCRYCYANPLSGQPAIPQSGPQRRRAALTDWQGAYRGRKCMAFRGYT